MRTSPYTRAGRARRRPFKRPPALGRRFVVVFAVTFSAACFFFGGDFLAYAAEGSFLFLGLTVLVCAIIAGASISSNGPDTFDDQPNCENRLSHDAERLKYSINDPYFYSPSSPGYVFRQKDDLTDEPYR